MKGLATEGARKDSVTLYTKVREDFSDKRTLGEVSDQVRERARLGRGGSVKVESSETP